MEVAFFVIVLIMSVVIHEVSHGYAANYLGDPTAKYEGRLTLNPLKHLDLFGSILLPLFLVITKAGVLFGWAKPVPYNPYNLRPGRFSEVTVAAVGPLSNLFLAIFFGLLFRLGTSTGYSVSFLEITAMIVHINLMLFVFNLIPIPPLDGSKILFGLFPNKLSSMRDTFERNGLIIVIIFIFFAGSIISPIVRSLFGLITGATI